MRAVIQERYGAGCGDTEAVFEKGTEVALTFDDR